MTEYDRGAYTPQPDAPLQFDARGPRGRRPMPMTLIGSGAVLVVVLGALAMHYRHDTGKDGVRPVGEPVAQVKTAAPASAQPKDAGAGVDVLSAAGPMAQATARAPSFAPPPETPKPRAQLTVQTDETIAPVRPLPTTNTVLPAPVVRIAKAAPAYHAPGLAQQPPATAPAAARPDATAIVAKVASTPTTGARAESPTTQKPVAVAKAAPATTKASASGAVVQIGAFSSTAQSERGYDAVSAAMPGDMGGKARRVETVEVNGKTYFRTSVTGFATRSAADAFCRSLAAKGHTCFAKG